MLKRWLHFFSFGLLNSALTFFAGLVLAKFADVEVFEAYLLYQPIILLSVSFFSLNSVGNVSVLRNHVSPTKFHSYENTYQFIAKVCCLLFLTVACLSGRQELVISTLIIYTLTLNAFYSAVLIQDKNAIRYSLAETITRSVLIFGWFVISQFQSGWFSLSSVLIVWAIGEILGGFVRCGWDFMKIAVGKSFLHREDLQALWTYGKKYLMLFCLGWAASYYDRYLLMALSDEGFVATFGVSMTLVGPLILLNSVFVNTITPDVYQTRSNAKKCRAIINSSLVKLFIVNALVSMILVVALEYIVETLFAQKYSLDVLFVYVFFLSASMVLNGGYRCVVTYLDANVFYKEKTVLFCSSLVIGFFVSLGFGIIWQNYGVVVGTLCSNLVLFAGSYLVLIRRANK